MLLNYKIIIKNNLLYISHCIAMLESVAKESGLSDKEIFRIKFSLEEVLTNTIESCIESDEVSDIEISINQISGGIEIVITDTGLPFNPFRESKAVQYNPNSEISRLDISEHLIHKMISKATFRNLGKKGKESRLILYSENFRITNLIQNEVQNLNANIFDDRYAKVRLFESDDSFSVSTLFYKSYGYSYVNDVVYFPDRLLDKIKMGIMHSAVAVSEKDIIIGFVSLKEPEVSNRITEWGMVVIDPRYRGQGIMNYCSDFIFNIAINRGYIGIYAHSVTNHVFTQKVCEKNGFTSCALLVGYAPNLSFKKINSNLSQRESTFIDFKYFDKPTQVELFVPQKYQIIINEIYSNLGVEIDILPITSDNYETSEHQISEYLSSELNSVDIIVNKFSPSGVEYIKKITKHYCMNQIDNLYLFLNLEDEYSMSKVEDIESLGYFFVGIFPEYTFRHTLILQYINNSKYDFEKICSCSDISTKLKEMIMKSYNCD